MKQRLALRGAEAVAAVIDFNDGDPDDDLDRLIGKCYTWYAARGQALGSLTAAPVEGNRSLYDVSPSGLASASS